MELTVCATDDEYEAWRAVRLAVEPGSRTHSLEELRAKDASDRLLLLALEEGHVVGCGLADRAETAGAGFVVPRVLPEHRRRGVGSALLRALAEHCSELHLSTMSAGVDDEGSLAFAAQFGFVEVHREVEQVRAVGDEPAPPAPPAGIEVIDASQRPDLWGACFETFGKEVLADFALYTPLEISAEQWDLDWGGDPMWLALLDDDVVGCAGLSRDTDRPERAENALTAVSRAWRGRCRLTPEAPNPALGGSQRARGDLHLDAGRQLLDAAPQRTPRLRHHPECHLTLPGFRSPPDDER